MCNTQPLFYAALVTVARMYLQYRKVSMSRKQPLLTLLERQELKSIPTNESTLIRLTSFTQQEMDLIDKRRGDANKLGFALQLC